MSEELINKTEEVVADEEGYTKQESKQSDIWLPQSEGEELKGVVEKVQEGIYGIQLLIRKTGTDEEVLTPSHKVLQARVSEVQEGDSIKLVYTGEEKASVKGQNPTKMYDVFIKT